jgi:hypothetical protein
MRLSQLFCSFTLLAISLPLLCAAQDVTANPTAPEFLMLVDFKNEKTESWIPVTDGLRPERQTPSEINLRIVGDQAVVSGFLSVEGGAGFASIRRQGQWDFSNFQSVRIEASGDGREYRFLIKDQKRLGTDVTFQASFRPTSTLSIQNIPYSEFKAVRRGREVTVTEPLDFSQIREIGLQINDQQEGPFQFQVQSFWIE